MTFSPSLAIRRPPRALHRTSAAGGGGRRVCAAAACTLLAVLAFAVWFASMLGMVHRTLHVPEAHYVATPAFATKVDGVSVPASAGDKIVRHARGLFALFGDHSVSDCNLYDQFAGWHVPMSVPPVVLPVILPAATFAWLEGEALARWVALFDARGPPVTR